MFQPDEESIVLEIVRGFFDVPADDMMKIGDLVKQFLFAPGVESQEAAVEQIRSALTDMPRDHILIAGVFLSGLLRCNLGPQIQQQYMQAMGEGHEECQEPEDQPHSE
ncbi:MAG: hypothetical protein GKC10_05910 [Methanosarcinales archaeon]|nr:hypothetical protein [Methanosarcinales archaeon]